MNIKRVILSAAISSALMSGSVMAAETGTVSFSGLITGATCDVNIGGAGANAAVVLPTVSANTLDGATKTNGKTRFSLELSGCTGALTQAKAFFEGGNTVTNATGRLINTETSGAENVSLQLRDGQNNSVINVGDAAQFDSAAIGYVDISSGMASLPYYVEYYAEGAVVAGTVASQVTYSLIYK